MVRAEHAPVRTTLLVALVVAGLLVLGGIAGAADGGSSSRGKRAIDPDTSFTALSATVPTPPQPVEGSDGKYHLAYEVLLTSIVPFEVDVTSFEVRDARTDDVLTTLGGATLLSALRPVADASSEEDPDSAAIGPSETAVVWLDVAVSKGDIPKTLVHRVDLQPVNPPPGAPANLDATVARVRVDRTKPIVLSSPLPKGIWLVSDGCCLDYTHHRRGMLAVDGDLVVPQRYAIDFYKLDEAHQTWTGDPSEVTSYLSYEQPVLSAHAGTVVASFDGLPNQQPPGPPPIPPIGDTVGNHVIVKVKRHVYLLYAHMKPGSVRVEKGDHVKEGQRIGLVGTSGNSSTPHLHFQVLTRPTFFPADSSPFVFERFDVVGHETERIWDDNIGLQPTGTIPYAAAQDPGPRRDAMPIDRDVITFP